MQSDNPASDPSRRQFKRRMTAIGLSLFVSVTLLAAKFYTFHLTRSSAVLSDALESIINVAAAGFAMVSIWMAGQPPDPGHPYGHGKIEFFSAGFEGALIIFAAIGIFKTGIAHLLMPTALENLQEGLMILIAASAINLLLGLGLIRIGRQVQSLTLIADGRHVLTDVYTSIGVVVGLFLVQMSGWLWLDGAIACLIGINILVTGIRLVSQSFSALMDASDPQLLDQIVRLLETHRRPAWIDIHQLRAWRSGNFVHIDLHLVLPREFSLEDAHNQAKYIENMIVGRFEGNADVLVHMDPCIAQECPVCRQYYCSLRNGDRPEATSAWNRNRLTMKKNDTTH
jgi:cation diffusion facilitator family transporter